MADESVQDKPRAAKTVARKSVSKHVGGFGDFLREYGVVALAVGFVFGAQVKSLVDQFTASFINPILGLVLPGKNSSLSQKELTLHLLHKVTVFAWGALVETLISFLITAALIYFTIKAFKLDKFAKKNKENKESIS